MVVSNMNLFALQNLDFSSIFVFNLLFEPPSPPPEPDDSRLLNSVCFDCQEIFEEYLSNYLMSTWARHELFRKEGVEAARE